MDMLVRDNGLGSEWSAIRKLGLVLRASTSQLTDCPSSARNRSKAVPRLEDTALLRCPNRWRDLCRAGEPIRPRGEG